MLIGLGPRTRDGAASQAGFSPCQTRASTERLSCPACSSSAQADPERLLTSTYPSHLRSAVRPSREGPMTGAALGHSQRLSGSTGSPASAAQGRAGAAFGVGLSVRLAIQPTGFERNREDDPSLGKVGDGRRWIRVSLLVGCMHCRQARCLRHARAEQPPVARHDPLPQAPSCIHRTPFAAEGSNFCLCAGSAESIGSVGMDGDRRYARRRCPSR